MIGKILPWSILTLGVAISGYLSFELHGQPEQQWMPMLNMINFIALTGIVWAD